MKQTFFRGLCGAIFLLSLVACSGLITGSLGGSTDELPSGTPASLKLAQSFGASATSIYASWEKTGAESVDYVIAYKQGSTAPTSCSPGAGVTVIPSSSVDETKNEHQITGLSEFTEYSFRVCGVGNVEANSDMTGTETTKPICDYRLAPGDLDDPGNPVSAGNNDGSDSFDEFEAFLTNSTDADNSDGAAFVTVCLDDGVEVINNNTLLGTDIALPFDDFYIYADHGDVAIFSTERFAAPTDWISGFEINFNKKTVLANLLIRTTGDDSYGVIVNANALSTHFERLTIRTYGADASGIRIEQTGKMGNIDSCKVTSYGTGTHEAVYVRGEVRNIINSRLTGGNPSATGLMVYQGKVWDAVDNDILGPFVPLSVAAVGRINRLGGTTNIHGGGMFTLGVVDISSTSTIGSLDGDVSLYANGSGAEGLSLYANGGVDAMNGVKIIRGAFSPNDGEAALYVDDTSVTDNYFDTANISNVTTCAEPGGSFKWADQLKEFIGGIPLVHNPYDGGTRYGVQTFPFTDLVGLGDQGNGINFIDGDCPNMPIPTGMVDTTFGTGGVVTTATGLSSFEVFDATFDSQGRLLVTSGGNTGGFNYWDIQRYDSDFNLDTTFDKGNDGSDYDGHIQIMDLNDARGIATDSQGRIIVIGGAPASGTSVRVARFTNEGELDTSFSGNGYDEFDFGTNEMFHDVLVYPDDSFLVSWHGNGGPAGTTVFKYLENGNLDTDFGTAGSVTLPTASQNQYEWNMMQTQEDGKIVIFGAGSLASNRAATISRITAAGVADTSFDGDGDSDGVIQIQFGSGNESAFRTGLVLDDGKLLAVGYAHNSDQDIIVAKFNSDGSLDKSFADLGVYTFDSGSGNEGAYHLHIQNDGKIIIAGNIRQGGETNFALYRLWPNGDPDLSFGVKGRTSRDIGGSESHRKILEMPDGNLILVGSGGDNVYIQKVYP